MNSVAGRVCVFGGEDAPRSAFDPFVHILDQGGSWRKAKNPLLGNPVLGHGAASLGSQVFFFGGREGGPNTFSGAAGESGAFRAFDVETETWTEFESEGSARPEPRSFHAMCAAGGVDNGHIFLFGGCGARGRLNDLWRYSPREGSWECLHPGGSADIAPIPRGGSGLAASSDGRRLVVIFGFSGEQQGDIGVFDLQKSKWEVLPQGDQKGDVPAPRSVFSMTVLQDKAIVFGGERKASDLGHEGAGAFTADLHALDLEALSWQALQAEGPGPEARGWAAMCPRTPQSILLFGGLNDQNVRMGEAWELEFAS